MAAETFDYTGNLARKLKEEYAEQAGSASIEQCVREAQASHPRAWVTWDDELQDVVINLSTGSIR